jgi:hypothetical protein
LVPEGFNPARVREKAKGEKSTRGKKKDEAN